MIFKKWLRRNRPADVTTGEARRALERSKANRPEVDALVQELRARRLRNNFAPTLEAALGAQPPRRR